MTFLADLLRRALGRRGALQQQRYPPEGATLVWDGRGELCWISQQHAADPYTDFWLVCGGRNVGRAVVARGQRHVELIDIKVDESHRGRGLGGQLHEVVKHAAIAWGAEQIGIDVERKASEDEQERLLAWYEGLGYQIRRVPWDAPRGVLSTGVLPLADAALQPD